MPKVLFFTSLPPSTAALLTQYAPPDFDVSTYPIDLPDAEKIPLVQDADFLILFPGQITEPVLRAATRVKLIQLVSVGFDKMDLPLCQQLDIPVANNGGANALDVAEHTLAMLLSFYRRMNELDRHVRNNQWSLIDSGATTYTIQNKTVGIIGLGKIGQRVARLLRAFGATVLYHDILPPNPTLEAELGVRRVPLETLLQQADVVTIHVPLNAETRGFISTQQLAQMKPTALLINTCRGPVIDEAALTETLKARRILGAALDVLEKEPPEPTNPLLTLDNVLFTPHTAGVTYDTWPRRGEFIFANLQRVWAGQTPLATV
ncbi:MAG: 2-hydroxyacid dehydrogenase, partial [Chloroflexi bacterium]|nr:2-hydroxyacid dehydrogenase [Chloroflexota bacterium]